MTNSNLIELIKAGDHRGFEQLYRDYRDEFLAWTGNNFSCSKDEAKDLFQDSIIDFHRNVKSGKLQELNCDVKTYLFAIGKNKALKRLNHQKVESHYFDSEVIKEKEKLNISIMADRKEENIEMVLHHLKYLPDSDRKVLHLYYSRGYDMESIARELGLKNADVAKKKKYIALKKLIAIVSEKLVSILL